MTMHEYVKSSRFQGDEKLKNISFCLNYMWKALRRVIYTWTVYITGHTKDSHDFCYDERANLFVKTNI